LAMSALAVYMLVKYARAAQVEKRLIISEIAPPASFVGLYVIWLLASSYSVAFDFVNYRLYSPIYIPLFGSLLKAASLAEHDEILKKPLNKYVKLTLLAIFIAWLGLSFNRTFRETAASINDGAGGYATQSWQGSRLMEWINNNPLGGKVFSNRPEDLYFFTRTRSRNCIVKYPYLSPESGRMYEDFVSESARGRLVYFFSKDPRFFSLEELDRMVGLTPMALFPEGGVFLIGRPGAARRADP